MDNFRINITAEGRQSLLKAFEIAAAHHASAVGYVVDAGAGLIFVWHVVEGRATKLPFKLDAAGMADFAERWLGEADYGKEPDHDGSNGRGWRVYNDAWGHVECTGFDEFYAICAVKPEWAMYGK